MRNWCGVLVALGTVSLVGVLAILHNFASNGDTFNLQQTLSSWRGTGCLEADANKTKCEITVYGNDNENRTNRFDESSKSSLQTDQEDDPLMETAVPGSSDIQTTSDQTEQEEFQNDPDTKNIASSGPNTNTDPENSGDNGENSGAGPLLHVSEPYETRRRRPKQRPCAPWIPQEKRKVLFIDGVSYELFHDPEMHHGGENYVFAAVEWALRQNGFEMDRAQYYQRNGQLGLNDPEGQNVTKDTAMTFHRVFLNGLEPISGLSTPELFCKLRNLHFWSDYVPSAAHYAQEFVYAPGQVWVPYEDPRNTFAGYFVHALLEEFSHGKNLHHNNNNNNNNNNNTRPRAGLILGKTPELLEGRKEVFQALVDAGFTLHVTAPCEQEEITSQETETDALDNKRRLLRPLGNITTNDDDDTRYNKMTSDPTISSDDEWENILFGNNPWTTRGETPSRSRRRKTVACSTLLPSEGIVYHDQMTPEEYADLMYNVTFLLGTGDPVVSPSPLVGFAHGVAFLNAAKDADSIQHAPLKDLGMPYVYNFDLRDPQTAVKSANLAQRHPFPPFVPWAYRPEAMVDRVCAMMEDDAYYASCMCLQQEQEEKRQQSQRRLNENTTRSETEDPLDCRASWYVRM